MFRLAGLVGGKLLTESSLPGCGVLWGFVRILVGNKRWFLSLFRHEFGILDGCTTIEEKSHCNNQYENYFHYSNFVGEFSTRMQFSGRGPSPTFCSRQAPDEAISHRKPPLSRMQSSDMAG